MNNNHNKKNIKIGSMSNTMLRTVLATKWTPFAVDLELASKPNMVTICNSSPRASGLLKHPLVQLCKNSMYLHIGKTATSNTINRSQEGRKETMGTSEAEIRAFALGKSREPTGPQVKCCGLDIKRPHRLVCFLVPSTALVLVLLWEAIEPLACEVHLRNVSQQGQAHGAYRPVLTSSLSGAFWSPCHRLNYITVRRMDSIPGKQWP